MQYILLGVGAFAVVIVVVYLRVATYFNIPLGSLLPSLPFTKNLSLVSPTPRVKPTSVQRLDMVNGTVLYTVKGKFVTTPTDVSDLFRSDFVIDEDPYKSHIPVYMPSKDAKMNMGKATDSLFRKIVWKLTPTEELRKAIRPNAPALLQIEYYPNQQDPARAVFQPALDRMIQGTWDFPQNFIFVPAGVAVVQ